MKLIGNDIHDRVFVGCGGSKAVVRTIREISQDIRTFFALKQCESSFGKFVQCVNWWLLNTIIPGSLKTPLHLAAQTCNEVAVGILIESGANVKAVTAQGFSALHVAAQTGNVASITMLVIAGAPINGVTRAGCSPLHEAAAKGLPTAAKNLRISANFYAFS